MHLYKVTVSMDSAGFSVEVIASSARIALDNAMTVGELTNRFDKDCGAIKNLCIDLLQRDIRKK